MGFIRDLGAEATLLMMLSAEVQMSTAYSSPEVGIQGTKAPAGCSDKIS
jgi:hypothetical protein